MAGGAAAGLPGGAPARLAIVALSARALAEAAVRAGFAPVAIDLFGDSDLAAVAEHRVVPGSLEGGADLAAVLAALDAAAAVGPLAGIVVGSGFEHFPQALVALAERAPLLAAPPAAVMLVKDPRRLSELLSRLSIPHPVTSTDRPAAPAGWLGKRAGAAGGSHVVAASDAVDAPGLYFQRRAEGRPMSAALLADGHGARLLAFCETRADPAPGAPFRFGGVAGPVMLPRALTAEIAVALDRLAAAAGLVGLCGVDLLVGDAGWCVLEVNPRPTATLEILDRAAPPLLALHVAACRGAPLADWSPPADIAGTALVYAPSAATAMPAVDWPAWVADRPRPGTPVAAGDPLCTVRADGADLAAVDACLADRRRRVLDLVFAAAAVG